MVEMSTFKVKNLNLTLIQFPNPKLLHPTSYFRPTVVVVFVACQILIYFFQLSIIVVPTLSEGLVLISNRTPISFGLHLSDFKISIHNGSSCSCSKLKTLYFFLPVVRCY